MNRPAVEVADILREQGDRFIEQNPWLSYQQLSVLRAIRRCRTAALGGHIDQCSQCGHQAISYNSCRNRHCPKCQAQARQRWLAAQIGFIAILHTGGRTCSCIRTYTAWFQPGDSPLTIKAGFTRNTTSSCP